MQFVVYDLSADGCEQLNEQPLTLVQVVELLMRLQAEEELDLTKVLLLAA